MKRIFSLLRLSIEVTAISILFSLTVFAGCSNCPGAAVGCSCCGSGTCARQACCNSCGGHAMEAAPKCANNPHCEWHVRCKYCNTKNDFYHSPCNSDGGGEGSAYDDTVTQQPTCENIGHGKYKKDWESHCTICGADKGHGTTTYNYDIAALGHDCTVDIRPQWQMVHEVPGTPGLFYTKKCSRCGLHWCQPDWGWFRQVVQVNYQNPDETWTTVNEFDQVLRWNSLVNWDYNQTVPYIDPVDEWNNVCWKVNYYSRYEKLTKIYVYRKQFTLDIDGEYALKQYVDQSDADIVREVYDNTGWSTTNPNNNLCTFDMYINGKLVQHNTRNYKNDHVLYGSTWEIKNITPDAGKHYYGSTVDPQ